VMGEGLTPDDFGAFKKQRRRWAEGGMQVLRHHLPALLGRSTLTRAQRYHFVAGWLPWIGDALHLVFTFGAIAWTALIFASPKHFHYPIALYMVPLVVFFGFKALFGPLLYLRRVGCSAREIAGAALAGMGLSHAIAQGVYAGLIRRDGIFEITRKGTKGPAKGLGVAREEGLLLVGLAICLVGVALTRKVNHLESALWMMVLTLQAVPYAAALACAWLSTLREKPAPAVAPLPDATLIGGQAAGAVTLGAGGVAAVASIGALQTGYGPTPPATSTPIIPASPSGMGAAIVAATGGVGTVTGVAVAVGMGIATTDGVGETAA
jgi:hypothetical protein